MTNSRHAVVTHIRSTEGGETKLRFRRHVGPRQHPGMWKDHSESASTKATADSGEHRNDDGAYGGTYGGR